MKISKISQAFEESLKYEGESDALYADRLEKSLRYWTILLEGVENNRSSLMMKLQTIEATMKKYNENIEVIKEQLRMARRVS